MKAENSITTGLLSETKVKYELELIDAEISRLRSMRDRLQKKYDSLIQEHKNKVEKALKIEIKGKNLCPICLAEHFGSAPDECYMKVHLAGYESEIAKRFNAFLKKNKLGSLD